MHNIEFFEYSENVNRAKVQKDLDNYVAHADWQEGASGLPNPIQWKDGSVYEDRDAAERAIEIADKSRWYNCMAVKFKEYPRPKPSKELTELRERVRKARDAYTTLQQEVSIQNRKSEFIGCPNCGSSLRREKLRSQNCPLCGVDLRSKTSLERLAKANERIKDTEVQIIKKERELERKGKPTVKWLVKIEYHT